MTVENLSFHDQVATYVLEHRGRGPFLPYPDYAIIDQWVIECAGDLDQLLLILSELLPSLYSAENSDDKMPPNLRRIDKKVLAKLRSAKKNKVPRLD